jgi:hypothetical protein
MKPDLYTKAILTVIAGSLLWLCMDGSIPLRAVSAQGTQRVVIVGIETTVAESGVLPVTLIGGTKYGHLQIDKDNPLAVEIEAK